MWKVRDRAYVRFRVLCNGIAAQLRDQWDADNFKSTMDMVTCELIPAHKEYSRIVKRLNQIRSVSRSIPNPRSTKKTIRKTFNADLMVKPPRNPPTKKFINRKTRSDKQVKA